MNLDHYIEELKTLVNVDCGTQTIDGVAAVAGIMQQLWQRASFGRTPMAILMIDVDHFKKFNDHYGHPAGDACLRQVCQVMKQTLTGQGVIVARFGGEEFIAAIPGLSILFTSLAFNLFGDGLRDVLDLRHD